MVLVYLSKYSLKQAVSIRKRHWKINLAIAEKTPVYKKQACSTVEHKTEKKNHINGNIQHSYDGLRVLMLYFPK